MTKINKNKTSKKKKSLGKLIGGLTVMTAALMGNGANAMPEEPTKCEGGDGIDTFENGCWPLLGTPPEDTRK